MSLRLSIVIPVLNEAPVLEASLEALQPWREIGEIIVVDGGSEDGSANLADPMVDQLLQSSRGRALQLNAGAARAGGERNPHDARCLARNHAPGDAGGPR